LYHNFRRFKEIIHPQVHIGKFRQRPFVFVFDENKAYSGAKRSFSVTGQAIWQGGRNTFPPASQTTSSTSLLSLLLVPVPIPDFLY
jgi:hypothetical protein